MVRAKIPSNFWDCHGRLTVNLRSHHRGHYFPIYKQHLRHRKVKWFVQGHTQWFGDKPNLGVPYSSPILPFTDYSSSILEAGKIRSFRITLQMEKLRQRKAKEYCLRSDSQEVFVLTPDPTSFLWVLDWSQRLSQPGLPWWRPFLSSIQNHSCLGVVGADLINAAS